MDQRAPGLSAAPGLFAYGTLQVPEVLGALCGSERAPVEAWLDDFARLCVRDAVYPAIVPRRGATTRGRLYLGLDAEDMRVLDAFEGELYERRLVDVGLAGAGEARAFAYVATARAARLLIDRPWDLDDFQRTHAARYVARCRQLRLELRGS